ncbi:hypothetical protein GCM10007859_21820 [Brevundimonas denitrificans]|uniref:Uncharacterized protein n=1 Tax=Brevundimonas denitrificans TaxID=1443434 RepID=A0ABQ6BLL6_9CAUL|nr:hypothetical protein [Brevundimonas denitrificans]GLS02161.1 hypothetical protein GCM10007859_21820 [Brevundimonas denitrificans]
MKIVMMAAAAALLATPAMAQDAASPENLVLPGATLAPDCGNLYGLAGRAFCVSAPLAGIGALADAYVADLQSKGWIPAGGEDNRVVFVRRRDTGGCDGLQMQAFYDTSRPAGPDAIGYLGFGPIPGNVCSDQPAAAPTPAPAQ